LILVYRAILAPGCHELSKNGKSDIFSLALDPRSQLCHICGNQQMLEGFFFRPTHAVPWSKEVNITMDDITTSAHRRIVEDFAKEIQSKQFDVRPSKTIIKFRTDEEDRIERDIAKVPLECLRYRKDNGRIASDVISYEQEHGSLDEDKNSGQEKLREFLERKDKKTTEELRNSIQHKGQSEPAIITCDGFLINGNRRKMVLEQLQKSHPNKPDYNYMKVVILPGEGEKGGPPTLLEIEQLENRYQLQKQGKSEYYGFDRAISIRQKIERGFSLEEQLRDDPQYVDCSPPQLKKVVKEYKEEYLDPLECVDRYLECFERPGLYTSVSSGVSDKEGRWQAFKDYSEFYNKSLKEEKGRFRLGIEDDEVGFIEDAAFKIIRLQDLKGVVSKLHILMRDFRHFCKNPYAKKEIIKISQEVQPSLPEDEGCDSDTADRKWAAKFATNIIHRVKKAKERKDAHDERETPITLLEAAYKKLTHEKMDTSSISFNDLRKARKFAADIQKRAQEIDKEIYAIKKKKDSFVTT